MKVTTHNLDQLGSGTLIKTFDKLDEVDADDVQKVAQATQFQTRISQELEKRGWVYQEDIGDWVYPL